jgi:hypothetical protein
MGNGLESQRRACLRRLRASRLPAAAAAAIVIAALAPQAALAAHAPARSAGHHGLPARTSSGKPVPARAASPKPPGLIPLSARPPEVRAELAAMAAASASAHRAGRTATVGALTTPTQLVTARPRGGFVLSAQVIPVRAKVGGRWVPVSLALGRDASGRYAAAATAYGIVSFSPGGTGPLVITRSGGTTVSVGWPGALPAPVIDGTVATYPGVLPGVDLQVSATPDGGFSDVLIVRNAAAGRNPALARLSLPVRVTGGSAVAGSGVLEVRPAKTGGMTLTASAPAMWDSRPAPAYISSGRGRAATRVRLNPAPSTGAAPGLAARVAPVSAALKAGALDLVPDRAMLTSPATRWPVYIDPTFHWHFPTVASPAFDQTKEGSPCNGVSEYDNTSAGDDSGQLGAGLQDFGTGCDGDYHSYYQWSLPSVIWGAHIGNAAAGTVVNAKEVYSATCGSGNYTVDMHQSGSIGPGTDWNNRPGALSGGLHATASFGPACTSNPSASFDVSSAIAAAASAHSSQLTVYLGEDSAEAEGNDVPFKRFADNPSLQIAYNIKPDTPTATQLSMAVGSSELACVTSGTYPVAGKSISSSTPVLTATVHDADGDALGAYFKYWINGQSTTTTSPIVDNVSSGHQAKYSLPSSFVSGLTNGEVIDWEVSEVTDGEDTAPGTPVVCHVQAEPSAPGQPSIAANSTYPEGAVGATPGTSATFTFTNTGTTATSMVYALDVQPSLSNPPPSELATQTGTNTYTGTVTPLSPGPHTLWVAARDSSNDASQWASYTFFAAPDPVTACTSLSACYNDTAISSDSAMSQGNADGRGDSFSATDLANAGWASGGTVTVDGAQFTLPSFGSGQKDNVLAAKQQIAYSYQVPTAGSSALMFLATSSLSSFAAPSGGDPLAAAPFTAPGTAVSGEYCFTGSTPDGYCPANGVITYTDGTSQPYDLAVPDWVNASPTALAAVTLPHENTPSGQTSAKTPSIYAFAVPLTAGKTVASVTLPDVGTLVAGAGAQSQLHIFSMATRNTTAGTIEAGTAAQPGSYVPAASGQSWSGAWASPDEGNYTASSLQSGNIASQTFRIAALPSLSGSTIRIKLDDALGVSPLKIGHVTVAADSPGGPNPVPAGAVQTLTFSGQQGVTIPAGGMVFSDPLSFPVTAGQYLLVSFDVTNSVSSMVEDTWTNTAYTFMTAPNSGDETGDTTGTPFTAGGWFTNLLTGLDVSTTGTPTLAVLGDNLTDAWQKGTSANHNGSNRLSDELATAEPTAPAPYGTVDASIESNELMTDNPESRSAGTSGGPALLSRLDRDVLDQPGISTVLLNEGLGDLLNGAAADGLDSSGYAPLLSYLSNAGISVVAVGPTPCGGYAGDKATTNDPCTSTVEGNRIAANNYLNGSAPMNAFSVPPLYYVNPDPVIGTPNARDGMVHLSDFADTGDHVNLTTAGYGALASAIMAPQDTWPLNDGSGATAADTVPNVGWFNPNDSGNDLSLSASGATWTADPNRGTVLTLDGTAGDAVTSGPDLANTSGSYSVSAWAKLASTAGNRVLISQDGSNASAFQLGYTAGNGDWEFAVNSADTASPTQAVVNGPAATAGTWTRLVGTYNAATKTASLYVNGTLAGTASVPAAFTSTGPLAIGRALSGGAPSAFWAGSVSDVQTWTYAIAPDEVTAISRPPAPASVFVPVTPVRIMDTRSASKIGPVTGPLTPGQTAVLPVAGTTPANLPATGVTAVAIAVTVLDQTHTGYLSLFPDGTALPGTSNLDFPATGVDTNNAIVPVGADGSLDIYNYLTGGTDQVITDITGYFTSDQAAAGASTYTPLADPARILDTRNGTGATKAQVPGNGTLKLTIAGNTTGGASIPATGVTAVALDLTAVPPSGDNGQIVAYPDGLSAAPAVTLGGYTGAARGNTMIIPVGSDGKIDIYNRASTPTDFVGDVSGYFTSGTGGQWFHPIDTSRIVDSRGADPLAANGSATISAPASIGTTDTTLVLNITALGGTANGDIQAYPSSAPEPTASIVDYATGQTVNNLDLANTATGNAFTLTNQSSGTVNYLVDISGYFQ